MFRNFRNNRFQNPNPKERKSFAVRMTSFCASQWRTGAGRFLGGARKRCHRFVRLFSELCHNLHDWQPALQYFAKFRPAAAQRRQTRQSPLASSCCSKSCCKRGDQVLSSAVSSAFQQNSAVSNSPNSNEVTTCASLAHTLPKLERFNAALISNAENTATLCACPRALAVSRQVRWLRGSQLRVEFSYQCRYVSTGR